MIKLYDLEYSGNCYKIRLFLSILRLDYDKIPVRFDLGENQSEAFLAMNPNGQVPVLSDGAHTIYDSAAILSYLASTYTEGQWLPQDSIELSHVIKWLAFEQAEGRFGLARARIIARDIKTPLANTGTLEQSQALGIQALNMLEQQLTHTQWLAGGRQPSICDIACYPYTALCTEGGLSLAGYDGVNAWIDRIQQLEGYVPLPG